MYRGEAGDEMVLVGSYGSLSSVDSVIVGFDQLIRSAGGCNLPLEGFGRCIVKDVELRLQPTRSKKLVHFGERHESVGVAVAF